MKISNLLLSISILSLTLSCATEEKMMSDERLDDTDKNTAYISFNVNTEKQQQQSGGSYMSGPLAGDTTITDCSLLIFNNDHTIHRVYDKLPVRDGQICSPLDHTLPCLTDVKWGRKETRQTFRIMIVANTTQTFTACKDYDAVQARLLDDSDLERKVKVSGLTDITFTRGYSSKDEARLHPASLDVTVKQLVSRIELSAVRVAFGDKTLSQNITIKDITLVNRNLQCTTAASMPHSKVFDNVTWDNGTSLPVVTPQAGGLQYADVHTKPYFYTFLNNHPLQGEETMLRFTLTCEEPGGYKEATFETPINLFTKNGADGAEGAAYCIRPGYLYRLVINASLISGTITCTTNCFTNDWRQNEIIYNL